MKIFKTLWLVLIAIITGGCSTSWPKGNMNSNKQPSEPCVAERIDGGVKITCPTSEAIVYDGEIGPSAEPIPGPIGPVGPKGDTGESIVGPAGSDGQSCIVQSDGLVKCGTSTYQLPVATSEDCQVFILPKE